jgi:hypothetical protein
VKLTLSFKGEKIMNRLPNFVFQLLSVVVGVFLLVMTTAFISLPYSMSAHPGEMPALGMLGAYHPS